MLSYTMISIDKLNKITKELFEETIIIPKYLQLSWQLKYNYDKYEVQNCIEREEYIAKHKSENICLAKIINCLYNPNKFMDSIVDNQSIKVFFITLNYTENKDKIHMFLQNTLKFLQYKIVKIALYNNEYFTKNINNVSIGHFHNHILLFTNKKYIYKSHLIDKIFKSSKNILYEKAYIDVKEIKRDKTFRYNLYNKINYIIGIKKNKFNLVKEDEELFKKMSIIKYDILGGDLLKGYLKTYIKSILKKELKMVENLSKLSFAKN